MHWPGARHIGASPHRRSPYCLTRYFDSLLSSTFLLSRPSQLFYCTTFTSCLCHQAVLAVTAVAEGEALKAVGIVVVEGSVEVKGLPMAMVMAVAVVAPHLSIEVEFPEVFATFFGLMVPVTASSTARSSTSKNPRRRRLPRYPPQRSKINCQIFSLGKA